jgi:uncharacterized membrane protein HdeD (DUF308 family)
MGSTWPGLYSSVVLVGVYASLEGGLTLMAQQRMKSDTGHELKNMGIVSGMKRGDVDNVR